MCMDAKGRRALSIIRACLDAERYLVLPHFVDRMGERGLVWPDVQAVIDDPTDVRSGGQDRWRRAKWLVRGKAADGLDIGIVCVLDTDDDGNVTVFITIY